jgi:beta-glucosidase
VRRSDFPADFLWGAGTSSHQVEGRTSNQWTAWETAHAEQRAATARQRLGRQANWPEIADEATDPANYRSGDAAQHYERFEADLDAAMALNLNAIRFSIEWSRIQPAPGHWNTEAIEHYRSYVAAAKARGLTPIPTLWHWTVPQWFAARGGFARHRNLPFFAAYVQRMAETIGQDVELILTLNEPNVYVTHGYADGRWPPHQHNPVAVVRVLRNLVHAHREAAEILHRANPALRIGMAHNVGCNLPADPTSRVDRAAAAALGYVWNWWFLDRVCASLDLIGLNFYNTEHWGGLKPQPSGAARNDMNWPMEPARLYDVLIDASRRYGRPLMVTENGLADAADRHRQWWLEESITAMARARADGADLRGYLHWSLLDNIEWDEGRWPRFGLIAVAADQTRTVRPSAHWWAGFLAGNDTVPARARAAETAAGQGEPHTG